MNYESNFNRRILELLEDITAKNREAQLKHIVLSSNLFTPIKKKEPVEPQTIFYTAKSRLSEISPDINDSIHTNKIINN